MRLNTRAQLGAQLVMIAFVFLMAIAGASVAVGTYLFVGPEFDVRQMEADILNTQIRECMTQNAFNLDSLKLDDIYSTCKLDKETVEATNLIKICYLRGGDAQNCISAQKPDEIASTGGDFVVCGLTEKNEKFPKCSINNFLVKSPKNYNLVIITVSNQKLRRAQ